MTLAIVACAIVMVVWLAPTSAQSFADIKTAWENLSHPWRDVQQNLGNAVAGLQGGVKQQPVHILRRCVTSWPPGCDGRCRIFAYPDATCNQHGTVLLAGTFL